MRPWVSRLSRSVDRAVCEPTTGVATRCHAFCHSPSLVPDRHRGFCATPAESAVTLIKFVFDFAARRFQPAPSLLRSSRSEGCFRRCCRHAGIGEAAFPHPTAAVSACSHGRSNAANVTQSPRPMLPKAPRHSDAFFTPACSHRAGSALKPFTQFSSGAMTCWLSRSVKTFQITFGVACGRALGFARNHRGSVADRSIVFARGVTIPHARIKSPARSGYQNFIFLNTSANQSHLATRKVQNPVSNKYQLTQTKSRRIGTDISFRVVIPTHKMFQNFLK